MFSLRRVPLGFILCLVCLLSFLRLLGPVAHQQQPPADAPEVSRELLYEPAQRIETNGQGVIFRAAQFTYRLDPSSDRWEVAREKNPQARVYPPIETYKSNPPDVEYHFVAADIDSEGILEIRRGNDPQPVARMTLWNRQEIARAWLPKFSGEAGLTVEKLAKETEPAGPEVSDVADDGKFLWLTIRFYAGEGTLGIGTLIRIDPRTNQAKIYQPHELAMSSVTHVASAGGALWLGTHHQGEGEAEPTLGLVRFDPGTSHLKNYLPETSKLLGRIVTALRADGNLLWVGTDEGMCRVALPQEEWTCWRIVPKVRLAAAVPVSNRPGGPPGGQLHAGSYEVLWANLGYFEVFTPDSFDGWLTMDDLEDYERRHFDSGGYQLGGLAVSVMRLLEKPGGDPLAGAQVYRAPLERVGSPRADGWQRVRAHVGWISRRELEVAPEIEPLSPKPAPKR
jgi:hypothetical protein